MAGIAAPLPIDPAPPATPPPKPLQNDFSVDDCCQEPFSG